MTRLGSAMILGVGLVSSLSIAALGQTASPNSSTPAAAAGSGAGVSAAGSATHRTPTMSKTALKNQKTMRAMRKIAAKPMKRHSAAARESGGNLSSTAVVSGVSGGGVANPKPPASAAPNTGGAEGTGNPQGNP